MKFTLKFIGSFAGGVGIIVLLFWGTGALAEGKNEQDRKRWAAEYAAEKSALSALVVEGGPEKLGDYSFLILRDRKTGQRLAVIYRYSAIAVTPLPSANP